MVTGIISSMKIAYVIGGLPFGGVESWLLDLARHVSKTSDFECRVFNVSGTGVKMPEYISSGVDVVCAGDSLDSIATHRIDTVLRLRSQLVEYAPDIIHTLHFSGDYFGRLASIGLGVPVVTHLRNIKRERKLRRRLANKLLSFFTDMYLSVSGAVADMVSNDHNIARRPSRVIYNAVDPKKLAVEPHDLTAMYGVSGRIVVGVGRYVGQKNFDLLLRALRLVLDEGHDISVVLVGEGGERPHLERLIRELSLEGHAVLTGYRQDVPRFLRASYALAMPSDFEGLPITHLEAMFCGLPAIVSRHVPSLEIAREASLVCKRSPESIAECIIRLLEDEKLHSTLSNAGSRIASEHTMDLYIKALKGIYDELASSGKVA